MKIISVTDDLFDLLNDQELLHNKNHRPHVLILKLTYKETKINFAVPFRSNIPPNANKLFYFSMPPRPSTKPKHRHGLHYIKAFPITNEYYAKCNIDDSKYYETIRKIANEKLTEIIHGMQHYLELYEQGLREKYCVDIDSAIKKLNIILSNNAQYTIPNSVAAISETDNSNTLI